MKTNLILLLIASFTFISCANKIDGSSDENYKASLEVIKSKLNDTDKAKFDDALKKIAFSDVTNLSDLTNIEGLIEDVKKKLDGMTYEDVIAEGDRMQKIIDDKNKEQAKIEILELYEKMEGSKKDSLELSKFKVEKSRYYKRKSGTYYITEEPIINITVLNGTDVAVSRAHFNGVIKSPERTITYKEKLDKIDEDT